MTYIYPELFKTTDEYKRWIVDNIKKVKDDGNEYVEAKWWFIQRYECTLVKRDREWWNETMEKIFIFWKEVKYYKKHSNKRKLLIEKKSGDKNDISKVEECLL